MKSNAMCGFGALDINVAEPTVERAITEPVIAALAAKAVRWMKG